MERSEMESLLTMPLAQIISMADRVRASETKPKLELCSIMNAKSGMCGEDCKFCAQSGRHSTEAISYPFKSKDEILACAMRAKDIGADRFDIVTSGNTLSGEELRMACDAISEITNKMGMKMCASLGCLGKAQALLLKKAGLSRYHHNIETSPAYFPRIVTTHTFQDRIDTIKAAKSVGLEVCSGGIIGMGESWADRIEMALILKKLDVDSVPINILVPIKGTPMEAVSPLSCADAVRTIAIFRIILKDKIIKIAAGRESILKDFQAMAFMAGANGMLIGGYLTIKGRAIEDDRRLAEEVENSWKR